MWSSLPLYHGPREPSPDERRRAARAQAGIKSQRARRTCPMCHRKFRPGIYGEFPLHKVKPGRVADWCFGSGRKVGFLPDGPMFPEIGEPRGVRR